VFPDKSYSRDQLQLLIRFLLTTRLKNAQPEAIKS
jgi:hypothetical protein